MNTNYMWEVKGNKKTKVLLALLGMISALLGLLSEDNVFAFICVVLFGSSLFAVFFRTDSKDSEGSALLFKQAMLLMDNIAASVTLRDFHGKILFCSPYTEVLTGYSVSEITSSGDDFFLSLINEKDRDSYLRAMSIAEVGEPFQFRYRFFHKTGIEMWAETRVVPIIGDDGEVRSTLSITLDMTASALYQRQVEERNKELRDFTYMISHDLKSPIFTIKGMLWVIVDELKENINPDLKNAIAHCKDSILRLEGLVESVLEYSRISTEPQSEPVNTGLSSVLQDVVDDFSQQIKDLNAKICASEDLPEVLGDRVKLYRIFSNILGNAIKYRAPERGLEVTIAEIKSNNPRTIVISVRDNGIGIPGDKLDLIFRPFQRAHRDIATGAGIGLASVKRLLEKIGGDITVSSKEGEGSCFNIELRRPVNN